MVLRAFRHDENPGAHLAQQFAVRSRFRKFGLRIPPDQENGIPSAHQHHVVGIKDGPELGGGARKLVAKLHPLEARRMRLAQALLQRNPAANFLHVIIGPANGIGTNSYRHRLFSLSFSSIKNGLYLLSMVGLDPTTQRLGHWVRPDDGEWQLNHQCSAWPAP